MMQPVHARQGSDLPGISAMHVPDSHGPGDSPEGPWAGLSQTAFSAGAGTVLWFYTEEGSPHLVLTRTA